jgi:acetylornithine deacetylase/succinyl-diaminopimelate desuccinylase-like protein
MDEGLAEYIADFGDKTREMDPLTGEPKVRRHYDIRTRMDGSFLLAVHGRTGHLGALPQNDPAIMKWAYIAHSLLERRRRGELRFRLVLPDPQGEARLVFEGAQGFMPTHDIETVKERLRSAFLRGISTYLESVEAPASTLACAITFNKLHNNAYTSDLDSPSIARAVLAAREMGMKGSEKLLGWNASCDARLFSNEYPSLPVITCGAGELGRAHSMEECVSLAQLFQMVEFTTMFLLRETASIAAPS